MEPNFDQTLNDFLRNPCTRTWTPLESTIMEYSNTAYMIHVDAAVNRQTSISTLSGAQSYLSSLVQPCSDQSTIGLDTIEERRTHLMDVVSRRITNLSSWSLLNMLNMLRVSDYNPVNAICYAILIALVVLAATKPWEE